MATPRTRGPRRALLVGLIALASSACSSPTPTPQPPAPTSTPQASSPASGTLRIALGADPLDLLIPSADEPTQLVLAFTQASLYRLGPDLAPGPDLAAAAPDVSKDGLTWRISLAVDRHFSDGSLVTAADALRSLQLALSPGCPFGDLCRLASTALARVAAPDPKHLVLTLRRPWAPLQTELLAVLPILPAADLDASLARLTANAAQTDQAALNDLLDRIEETTNADACLSAPETSGCDLTSYRTFLETVLERAQVTLPVAAQYLAPDDTPDADAYAAALLERVKALGRALAASGIDRLAYALPLLDLESRPVGAGPFRFQAYTPGGAVDLVRSGSPPEARLPTRVHLAIIRDGSAAATAFEAGDLDWIPDLRADLVAGLATMGSARVAARPSDSFWALVFNVRPGHPYADPVARTAFATCLDRRQLWQEATQGSGLLATGLLAAGSWAADPALAWPPFEAKAARASLEADGWRTGSDGIYARDGVVLRSTIYVRPGRADLLTFAAAAATQLRTCGIALDVRAQNLSGRALLAQLEFPNDFATYFGLRGVGLDPDEDLGRLATSRITTAADAGDANFGGWHDAHTDAILKAALASPDPVARRTAYAELQAHLASAVPVLPIGWEPAYAAVAGRLQAGGRPVDPALAGYEREVLGWQLSSP